MKPPLTSIIVLNWNGKTFLEACFNSIRDQTSTDYEAILADNNSSDGSAEFVRENYPDVDVLALEENLGYTGANNAAARRARGGFLVFLNNDAKLAPDFVEQLSRFIGKNPAARIIAAREYSYDGKNFVSQRDGFDFLGYGCSFQEGKTCTAPGCAFIIEKHLFDKLEGFDEKMFIFHEELDLCWRAFLLGERVQPADGCRFYHLTGGGVPTWTIRRRYLGERNNIRSILKNYSYPTQALIIPIYLLINCLEVGYLLLTGQFKTVREAYWRAWTDNLKDRRDIAREHAKVQRQRVISDWEYLKRTRLVIGKWRAFLGNRSELVFRG